MEQYIKKSDIEKEIKRKRNESWLGIYTKENGIIFDITDEILSFLDTLEVKEEPVSEDLEELRARAAIAALPKCIETVETVLLRGGRIEGTIAEQAAYTAVMYADALVEKLKEGKQ